MNSLARMRRGSWLAVLLLAALVIVPAADCLLFNGHAGSRDHHSLTAAAPADAPDHDHAAASDAATDHDHATATADMVQQCFAHAVHCPDTALPPGIVSLTLAALVLAAFTAVWTPVSAPDSRAGGIRGPPSAPRSPDGRTVLTLFCISRR